MLDFVYTNDYNTPSLSTSCSPTACHDLSLHASVYAVGEKYDLPSLKQLAVEKFQRGSKIAWENEDFYRAVQIAFTTTSDSDKGMRNAVTEVILAHARRFANNRDMEAVVRSVDGLAYDLWKSAANVPIGPSCSACGNVYVKECGRCPKFHPKKSNLTRYFVTCDCSPDVECCHRHRVEIEEGDMFGLQREYPIDM